MATEKLWLIRQEDSFKDYAITTGPEPTLLCNGIVDSSSTSGVTVVGEIAGDLFETYFGTKLKDGQCIEITGFKVLLPKSR